MQCIYDYNKADKVQKQLLALVVFCHLLLLFVCTLHFNTTIVPKKGTKLVVHTYTAQQKKEVRRVEQKNVGIQETVNQKTVEEPPQQIEKQVQENVVNAEPRVKTAELKNSLPQKSLAQKSLLQNNSPQKPKVEKQPVQNKIQSPPQKKVAAKAPKPLPATKPIQPAPKSEPQKKMQQDTIQKENIQKEKLAKQKALQEKQFQEKLLQEKLLQKKQLQEKQNALIVDALSSLNKIEKNNFKSSQSTVSPSKNIEKTPQIQSLASESLITECQNEPHSAEEKTYYDELVHRLKLHLKLPDTGDVRLKLTLNRQGKVVRVECIEAKSQKNKAHLEKTLPTIVFPAFGHNFTHEQTHTFLLHFSQDFSYY